MSNQAITIRDLADNCTTTEAYADLCRECGTDAMTEEGAILSATKAPHAAGSAEYWLWLADQTCTAQEENDRKYASEVID